MQKSKDVNRLKTGILYDSFPKSKKAPKSWSLSDRDIVRGREGAIDAIDSYRSHHSQDETSMFAYIKMVQQWKHIREGTIASYVGSAVGAEEEYSHYSTYGTHRFEKGK